MPIPLAPVALAALRVAPIAVAAWAVARGVQQGRTDQRAEDALDDLPEGVSAHRPRDAAERGGAQGNAAARLRRRIRLGKDGPAFDIDVAAFGRISLRKVTD